MGRVRTIRGLAGEPGRTTIDCRLLDKVTACTTKHRLKMRVAGVHLLTWFARAWIFVYNCLG
jgi:hypothetical protein